MISDAANTAAEKRPLQICNVLPKVLPDSILNPRPPPPPDGNSPTIAPTKAAAIPSFSDVKKYGIDFGRRNFTKTCEPDADQVFI